MHKYIVGSGWFSDPDNKTDMGKLNNQFQKRYGGSASRTSEFSKYWLSSILAQSILPEKIFILDANSPEEIDEKVKNHKLVEISKQLKNFGHGVICVEQNILCGWARGFIYGATQAYLNDLNYVYVEQDLLLFGDKFIENIFDLLEKNKKEICYLTGNETPQKLQQSVVIVKHSYLPKLISGLINCTDHTISEELKHHNIIKNDVMWSPYSGGRQRKNLNPDNFCLQHMTINEINYYKQAGKIKDILS
jgi:hypothetical protein